MLRMIEMNQIPYLKTQTWEYVCVCVHTERGKREGREEKENYLFFFTL